MKNLDNYGLIEINQKEFNRCRNRLTTAAINLYNLSDRKSQLLLQDWISEKLNDLIARFKGKINLNTVTLEMIDVKW